MEKIVIVEIPVGSVLCQSRMNAIPPVWGGGYKVDVTDLLPVKFEPYHNAGGGDAASARHDKVFYLIGYILDLCSNGTEQDV